MNVFRNARFKLTLWYVIIMLIITGSISLAFYYRATGVIRLQIEHIQQRLSVESSRMSPAFRRRQSLPLVQDLEQAKQNLAKQLVLLNGVILIFTAGAGYLLSGKTLEPIQEALDEQARFVADAAHELRTPITGLKTSLEVSLLDDSLPQAAQQILQDNLADVQSLEDLTDSLLRLARINNAALRIEAVPVTAILSRAHKHIKPIAAQKKLTLSFPLESSSLQVAADESAVVDLMLALLDNAVKYSPANTTITVSVRPTRRHVQFRVKDEGPGIPPEEQEHIFDRFYRLDEARCHTDCGGYGLGLSIAQKIAHEHGGSLVVETSSPQGTTFRATLPKA